MKKIIYLAICCVILLAFSIFTLSGCYNNAALPTIAQNVEETSADVSPAVESPHHISLFPFNSPIEFYYPSPELLDSVGSDDSLVGLIQDKIIHHYTWLENHLGLLVLMEVVVQFDNEQLLDDEGRNRVLSLDRLRLVEKICDALREDLSEYVVGVMSAETMTPRPHPAPEGRKLLSYLAYELTFSRQLDNARPDLRDYITIEGNLSFLSGRDRMQNLAQIDITPEEADRLIAVGIDDVKKLAAVSNDMEFAGIPRDELRELRRKAIEWQSNYGIDMWRICLLLPQNTSMDSVRFIEEASGVIEPIIAELNQQLGLENPAIQAVYSEIDHRGVELVKNGGNFATRIKNMASAIRTAQITNASQTASQSREETI
ncbi:MAG: hypothetical protein FWG73_02280 [Planctomycetaceae bacterium]|nr:hypothetical protein [Planctomycetaceae bacterium]